MGIDDKNYLVKSEDLGKEKERLEKQYKVVKTLALLGQTIPEQSVRWPKDAKVLDAGTGTGIWLMELAQVVPPSASLYGIDISTKLVPRSVPSNVHFQECSVTSLPKLWSNQFQFIHQQLLTGALRKTDWPTVMAEFFRVLVPGEGRIQLIEPADWVPSSPHPRPDSHVLRIRELFQAKAAETGHDLTVTLDIPHYLMLAGFVDITVHRRPIDIGAWAGQAGLDAKSMVVSAWRSVVPAIVQGNNSLGIGREEFLGLIDQAEREFDESPGYQYAWHVIEARRPA